MEQVAKVPGVIGVAPFSINPMMLTHGDATATGVLLKGVDPASSLGGEAPAGTVPVLDLPKHIVGCGELATPEEKVACGQKKLHGLRLSNAQPAQRRVTGLGDVPPSPAPIDELPDAGADEIDDA